MRENYERSLKAVIDTEGGFVNHPSDPGGATMRGITLGTYRRWFGREKDVSDLKGISWEEIDHIFRMGYWNVVRADDLPTGLDLSVVDMEFNSGRGDRLLQGMVGAKIDGVVGPKTLAALDEFLQRYPLRVVISRYRAMRVAYYEGLPTFDVFGRGWTNRANDICDLALDWISGPPADKLIAGEFGGPLRGAPQPPQQFDGRDGDLRALGDRVKRLEESTDSHDRAVMDVAKRLRALERDVHAISDWMDGAGVIAAKVRGSGS